jgi:hypothetical protein
MLVVLKAKFTLLFGVTLPVIKRIDFNKLESVIFIGIFFLGCSREVVCCFLGWAKGC